MPATGGQILADAEIGTPHVAQILEYLKQLPFRLPHPEHDTGFGLDVRGHRGAQAQHLKRAAIIGTAANLVEPRHRLDVVGDDIRARYNNRFNTGHSPLKIRYQQLDPRSRRGVADGCHCGGVDSCTAIRQIVAGRAGYDHMGEFQTGDRLGNPRRFIDINRKRHRFFNITEAAEAGTTPPENQERGLTAGKTFRNIGAERLLTDRIQAQLTK